MMGEQLIIDRMESIVAHLSDQNALDLRLVNELLLLRDNLTLENPDWFRNFTQELVTLDSAATFKPRNIQEESKLEQAVRSSLQAISTLLAEIKK